MAPWFRRLAHEPFGWRPTLLLVTVRRYRCTECGHVWRQDTSKAAEPRAKLSRRALRWALEGIVVAHLTVARIAEGLAVSWNTANDAVLAEGKRALIDDPKRFDGVQVIGVDEHVWRHTRKGDKYVTVVIDLTPVRDDTGPARLLDMVEGGIHPTLPTDRFEHLDTTPTRHAWPPLRRQRRQSRVGPDQTVTTAPACHTRGQNGPSRWGQIRVSFPGRSVH